MSDTVKCVVWDLDNTLWTGVLAEGDEVELRDGVIDVMKGLDERGILQSVASRNDADRAFDQLRRFGVEEYVLHPQVNWGPKSHSIARIAELLNLGTDSFLFVDDDAYERDEVLFNHPAVRTAAAPADVRDLLDRPDLNPPVRTAEARQRRLLYRAEAQRRAVEEKFDGPRDAFLASLDMTLAIRHARPGDLARASELTVRTHQLNATGYTYSHDELEQFSRSPRHRLVVAELDDRFGTYGVVGIALVECATGTWRLKLLLMSCRVMGRGAGGVLLNWIVGEARRAGVRLLAEFVPTDRNRAMFVTYRFAGFREVGAEGAVTVLENTRTTEPILPPYIALRAEPLTERPVTGK